MGRTKFSKKAKAEVTLPANTTHIQAMDYWRRFAGGESEWDIGQSAGRELSTIQQCLAYIALMKGAPSAAVERGRLMDSYHTSMVRLNEQIESQRLRIAELDTIVSEGPKVQSPRDFEAELDEADAPLGGEDNAYDERVELSMKSWLSVCMQRDASISVLVKLQTELRNVQSALYDMFGLKHLAIPDDGKKDEEEEKSNLDSLSIDELKQLAQGAIDAEYEDA